MTSHRRLLLFSLTAAITCGTSAPAQSKNRQQPPLLAARNAVVDLESGKSTRLPGIKGYVVRADARNDSVFDVANLNVDVATSTQVRTTKQHVLLETLSGKAKWSVALESLALASQPGVHDRRLTKERVLVKSAGSIIALERATGNVAWRQDHGRTQAWTVRGGLLVTVTQDTDGSVLRVMSLQNGALASQVKLEAQPQAIVIGDHGIAVASQQQLRVFDRFGPELFKQTGSGTVVAHPDGWIVLRDATLSLLDRQGEAMWHAKMTKPKFLNSHELHVTATGNVILTTHHFMSDSGVFCQAFDGKSGEQQWTRQLAGLGIPHSKYFHHAYARSRKGVVDIISQGSGGAFVVTLDAGSGAQAQRIKVQ